MPARRSQYLFEIFLVSFAALLLEISYTRVFSFKASSYYTYLIIGFALLGLGSGGVFVAVRPRLREAALDGLLPRVALVGALAVGVGYALVASLEIDSFAPPTDPGPLGTLLLVCLTLFGSFLSVGIFVAAVFARESEAIHRLYFADLLGAGTGCAAAVPFMLWLTPPGCVVTAGAALALSGLRPALRSARPLAAASAGVAVALAGLALFADRLPDPVVDPMKSLGRLGRRSLALSPVFHRWHPVFRVDVLDSPALPHRKIIAHDGHFGSVLWRFSGDRADLAASYEGSNRQLPFAVAPARPRTLVIGSAGGNEIRASLHFDAASVTGVELNPVTVSLLRDHFADYTGRLTENERVTLVNAEGRSFLMRDEQRYDLIWFVAPDSYAAMNAAAASSFVLVESYLYTRQMILEALEHLTPGGVICMQFGEIDYESRPNRTARYLVTARAAFAEIGIRDFGRHVFLVTNPDFPVQLSTLILSKQPFRPEDLRRFAEAVASVPGALLRHPHRNGEEDSVTSQVILLPDEELATLLDEYRYDISAVGDDAPFFWHFARFRDLILGDWSGRRPIDPEQGYGEQTLLMMLFVSVAFAVAFLLLPFALIRERWRTLPHKTESAVYFASLGLGFMCLEIPLLQKLTLFLGYPTYTLSVTLFALLVFSGIGSLASGLYVERRDRALGLLLGTLAVLTLLLQLGSADAIEAMIGLPLGLRIATAVVLLAPLGLVLGAFLPLGISTVSQLSPYPGEYVAWSWAVNGVFSVLGSLLATILSMSYGFRAVMLLALAIYAIGAVALRRIPSPAPAPEASAS